MKDRKKITKRAVSLCAASSLSLALAMGGGLAAFSIPIDSTIARLASTNAALAVWADDVTVQSYSLTHKESPIELNVHVAGAKGFITWRIHSVGASGSWMNGDLGLPPSDGKPDFVNGVNRVLLGDTKRIKTPGVNRVEISAMDQSTGQVALAFVNLTIVGKGKIRVLGISGDSTKGSSRTIWGKASASLMFQPVTVYYKAPGKAKFAKVGRTKLVPTALGATWVLQTKRIGPGKVYAKVASASVIKTKSARFKVTTKALKTKIPKSVKVALKVQ